jgi:starch phosphorylase
MYPGDEDLEAAIAELATRLPSRLAPLARVAYDYGWAWDRDGAAVLEAVSPHRWAACHQNPVRLLSEARAADLTAAAADASLVDRVRQLAERLAAQRARPPTGGEAASTEHPIAFMCAEYAVHHSLPIYSGGLGVLAGDIVKEASDLALPMVAIGLLYRTGYFHQRIDTAGTQHEYWVDTDPERLPCVRLRGPTGAPLNLSVPINGEEVATAVWRVDVGRVPLYLLDTDQPPNSPMARWITSRLYDQNRLIRLAQYAVLGVGGIRLLDALGIQPSVHHLNEGHPALSAAERVGERVAAGDTVDAAWAAVRQDLVFTTHTPVAAGNETYSRDEILAMLGAIADSTGDRERFLALGRVDEADASEPSGMTALALRVSRSANGVSRRHGEVARGLWRSVFHAASPDDVPITYVTNGVHIPTWLAAPMRDLLDRHLGEAWGRRAHDPATWEPVDDISDLDLWATRRELRRRMVAVVEHQAITDRFRRGESLAYAEAVEAFDPDRLTVGFARRLATYKRLSLLSLAPERALGLLQGEHPVQFVFAGKAHPADDEAKQVLREIFTLKDSPEVAGRAAFLEDYDLPLAAALVAGCDVWVNLPRPPQEASGTSGMKATLNGGLHLSVLDGWWAEAYDGTNGWAIDGHVDPDDAAKDQRDATQLFDLLEQEVIPTFWRRDDAGLPTEWLRLVRASLRTNGPRFSATRMVQEYATRIYPRR